MKSQSRSQSNATKWIFRNSFPFSWNSVVWRLASSHDFTHILPHLDRIAAQIPTSAIQLYRIIVSIFELFHLESEFLDRNRISISRPGVTFLSNSHTRLLSGEFSISLFPNPFTGHVFGSCNHSAPSRTRFINHRIFSFSSIFSRFIT